MKKFRSQGRVVSKQENKCLDSSLKASRRYKMKEKTMPRGKSGFPRKTEIKEYRKKRII
jgi:hypothetical protein